MASLEDKLNPILKKAKYLTLLATIPLIASCTTNHYKPTPRTITPSHEISIFQYEKQPINPYIKIKKETETYTQYKVRFPSKMQTHPKNDTVKAYYYQPKKEGKSPTIIVLPTIGGENFNIDTSFMSKYLAEEYAKKGYNVMYFEKKRLLVDLESENIDELFSHTSKVLKQSVIDVKTGLDWLETQPQIDKDKIGVTGLSLGSLVAALLTETDERFKAAVLIYSGGNIPQIISTTEEITLRKLKKKIKKKYNINSKEYAQKAEEHLKDIDPLTYASSADPSKILMINGTFDQVIEEEYTKELWKKLGKPTKINIPTGHYTMPLALTYFLQKGDEHFREIFEYDYQPPKKEYSNIRR